MQMLNFDYKNKFIVNVPKLNGPKLNIKSKKSNSNTYLVITSVIIIVIMFNFNRGLKN